MKTIPQFFYESDRGCIPMVVVVFLWAIVFPIRIVVLGFIVVIMPPCIHGERTKAVLEFFNFD